MTKKSSTAKNSVDGFLAAMPSVGKAAPALSLADQEEEKIKLSDFKGKKNVVLYFYPKDLTSGCTQEAIEFSALMSKFAKCDTVILGVSPDSCATHVKFISKHEINFTLLSDPDHKIAEKYGVWVEKSMYGRKYMGILRSTFLIDKKGSIAEIWPKVKVAGHAAEVLVAASRLA